MVGQGESEADVAGGRGNFLGQVGKELRLEAVRVAAAKDGGDLLSGVGMEESEGTGDATAKAIGHALGEIVGVGDAEQDEAALAPLEEGVEDGFHFDDARLGAVGQDEAVDLVNDQEAGRVCALGPSVDGGGGLGVDAEFLAGQAEGEIGQEATRPGVGHAVELDRAMISLCTSLERGVDDRGFAGAGDANDEHVAGATGECSLDERGDVVELCFATFEHF